MKVLQLDVENMSYELIEPEASVYDESEEKNFKVEDAVVGYSGPETGVRDRSSYLMLQGDVRLMFTGFLYRQSEISRHVELHGDGVKDISIDVNDINDTISFIKENGVVNPGIVAKQRGEGGIISKAELKTFGDTVHTLRDYGEWDSELPPGFKEIESVDIGLYNKRGYFNLA